MTFSPNCNTRVHSGTVTVIENVHLACATWRIRLHAPTIAAIIRPGQFVMLRQPGGTDPLLGRPFALYDTVLDETGRAVALDIVYLVIGKLTSWLATLQAEDQVEVWGPLGNGFLKLQSKEHVALVAGGIGRTPFLAHIRDLLGQRRYGGQETFRQTQRVSVYYGVRSTELLAGVEDFRDAGAEVFVATDDGSAGYRGFVTDLFDSHFIQAHHSAPPDHIVGCGPEPMMHALANIAKLRGIPCHLSLETPMACGVGICFSCVTPVKTADGWDYKRVCVDGPVFSADQLAW